MRASMLLWFVLTTACGHSVYSVRDTDNGGIPFFPFEAVDVTTVTHTQNWYEITLTGDVVPANTKPEDYAKAKFVETQTYYTVSETAAELAMSEFNSKQSAQEAFTHTNKKMQKDGGYSRHEPAVVDWLSPGWSTKLPVASISRTRTQVAASTPKYINSTAPFAGSANGTVQLAANGTLAQTQAQIQDQFPGTALTGLTGLATAAITGYSGVVAARVTASKAFLQPPLAEGPQYASAKISVTPVRRAYKITVERSVAASPACTASADELLQLNAPMVASVCRASMVIEVVHGDDAPTPPADPNAIQIKGTVVLPGDKK